MENMSNKTNTGLVVHAAAQLGCCYWWGTFGQIATPDLLAQKAAQYPEQYSAARQATAKQKHIGKRVYDCCGLVKSYWMQESPAAEPKYNEKYDVNVGGLIRACAQTGAMSSLPETPGILVFRGTAHVGIYAGGGEVIEAKAPRFYSPVQAPYHHQTHYQKG